MKIYHNPRCSKSRQALEILQTKGLQPEIVLYLENPPSKQELKGILKMLGIKAEDLLRKNEETYKSQYKEKKLSDDEWIEVMIQNPKLIERPIFINKNKAVIGRPPEKVLEIV